MCRERMFLSLFLPILVFAFAVSTTAVHAESDSDSSSYLQVASDSPSGWLYILAYPGWYNGSYVLMTPPDYGSLLLTCPNPETDLANCVDNSQFWATDQLEGPPPITDGVNVYYTVALDSSSGVKSYGGFYCEVGAFETYNRCSSVFMGPVDNTDTPGTTPEVVSVVTSGGYFFIGQYDGTIHRCLIILGESKEDCELWDNAGTDRYPAKMIRANGRLYVGLIGEGDVEKSSIIWSCSLEDPNSCEDLDSPGGTKIFSLAFGAGYLWAGLQNGVIWRCDPDQENMCTTWDSAAGPITSLSYDGMGTIYAAIEGTSAFATTNPKDPAVLWSCPTDQRNSCGDVYRNQTKLGTSGTVVASPLGGVFSSGCTADPAGGYSPDSTYTYATLFSGAEPEQSFYIENSIYNYPFENNPVCNRSQALGLLYLSSDGVTDPGSVDVAVPLAGPASRLEARCDGGAVVPAKFVVTGPYGYARDRKVDLCQVRRDDGVPMVNFGVLDEGEYRAVVKTTGSMSGRATFAVSDGVVTSLTVDLEPRSR